MTERKPKRKIRDNVFTDLFHDKKYLLQLYQTIHPEDVNVREEDISIVTLKHILVNAGYNDLGFSVGDHLIVFIESQSTWSVNIILRLMFYFSSTYDEFYRDTDQNLYGSKKVEFPIPEFYVIYTGERKNIPEVITLSEEFADGQEIAVDIKVKVLYHEDEKNIIGQYIIFCKVYTQQLRRYGRNAKAVTETIRICKDRNVLKEYLESKEQEVAGMMTVLKDDWIYAMHEKEIAERAAARAAKKAAREATIKAEAKAKKHTKEATRKAKIETATDTARNLIRIGKMSLEDIAACIPSLSMKELKELQAQLMK